MKPTYPTGQPVNLFDGVIASLGENLNHAGVVIGLAADNKVTVALVDARYCESDGRKEATERGQMTRFFRADQGIVCLETLGVTLEPSKLTLAAASIWDGTGLPNLGARGVIDALDVAVCSPQPLSKSASSSSTGGGATVTQDAG